MAIYFGICFLMLALVYIKVYGEVVAFKKKYPNAVFRKNNAAQNFINTVKLLIYFSIPLVNLIVFLGTLFVISDAEIERVIKARCEVC